MLKEAFENVAPYLSNIDAVREFVIENDGLKEDEMINKLEEKISSVEDPLRTDFKILLNEVSKKLNMEM